MKRLHRSSGLHRFSPTARAGTLRLLSFLLITLLALQAQAQNRILSGQVISSTGSGLAGATVRIKNNDAAGTSTDSAGNFTLSIPQAATLVITFVGYGTQELAVAPDQNNVVITMQADGVQLNEVVVIGYGTASKRDLTGSIVKIAGEVVADKPNPNPVASLQGRVAGLSVVNSGTPGQEPDIRIRGTVSIGAVKPLYVVDGIFNDNIDFLNPNDIESIEVLKDPSSLAIFGVRGASGVIAITTKKARAGQTLINFNSTFGARRLVDRIAMVDAAGFKELFQEEEINLGIPQNQRFDFGPWTGNTDWVDAMVRTGLFSSNNLSFTGASDRNRFYMGVGFISEEGVVRHEKLDRITLSLNNEYKASKNIRIGFNLNGIRQKLPFSQANGLLFDARRVLPITPVKDPTGQYFTELAVQAAQLSNPVMNLENEWNTENRIENRLVGSVFAEINFLRNFTFRSTLYGDMSQLNTQRYNPIIYTYNPVLDSVYVDRNHRLTSVVNNKENWNKYQQDHVLTYRKDFGRHAITGTSGFTTVYNDYRGLFASVAQKATGDPIPNDERFWHINNGFGDQVSQRSSSGQWERTTVSGFLRALYNYENKYYLNASFRRDGSSQISPANRWQSFYSVGAAWEASRENFMANVKQINFLKLKGSWGVLGVQNTAGFDYPFYPALLTGNTAVFGSNIVPSYTLAYSPDRDLRWEQVASYEFGFEANAFDNKLFVEAAYYNKRTKDLMIAERTGGAVGNRLGNIGEIVNRGIELTSSWTQSFGNGLTVTVGGNFTTFDNLVAVLPEGSIQYPSEERPNKTEQGYPIGYFFGYVVEGVYQSYADKLRSPKVVGYEYGPGDLKYKDINNDGIIDATDRTMIGNPTPDFAYGFNLAANWKGIDVGIDFNGVFGNEIYRFWGSSELPFTNFNYPTFRLNRWRGPGTSNWDPILGANRVINRLPSTFGIEDGSYLRIRNLQIGYNVPTAALGRYRMKSFRIFANVQNLKTWKRNSGYTPEFGGSPTSFGIDNGNGPLPAVYTGGINVTF